MDPKAGNDCQVIPFRLRPRVTSQHRVGLFSEEWCGIHVPWVRVAVLMQAKTDQALEAAITELAADEDDDTLAAMFDYWRQAKRDLDDVRDALDVALNRCLDAVERTGKRVDELRPTI
jgi:hypothetical protein